MALYSDLVKETSSSTGTGSITLAGAVTGYQSFNTAFSTGVPLSYVIQAVDASGVPTGSWEVGIGNLTGTTTLARDFVQASSNSGAVVDFAAGTKNVYCAWSANQALQAAAMNAFELQFGTL